jgi:hypothetical protein
MLAANYWVLSQHHVMGFIRFTALVLGLSVYLSCYSQIAELATPSTTAKSASVVNINAAPANPAASTPRWIDLTLSQQESLMPLVDTWNTLDQSQKRKWIALAQNYPSLAAPEQAKLHSRMEKWAVLNPSKREQARLNFSRTKIIASPERASNWEAYKALSPEERISLANRASAKPKGAANAVKPVISEKLTAVPITRRTPVELREQAFSRQLIDRNTLLPLVPRPSRPWNEPPHDGPPAGPYHYRGQESPETKLITQP